MEVLDYQPVLGEEQFWLADQLRKTVFAYKITLLKAMLPSVLNSSYDKILHPTELLSPEDREDILEQRPAWPFLLWILMHKHE